MKTEDLSFLELRDMVCSYTENLIRKECKLQDLLNQVLELKNEYQ